MQSKKNLRIHSLHAAIDETQILNGVDLDIHSGQLHVVMGPNGSGKSTLTYVLMGHPNYKITNSDAKIVLEGKNLIGIAPHERAKLGLMLAFQNPIAVPGVTLSSFLRTAFVELHGKEALTITQFHQFMHEQAKYLHLEKDFLRRSINDGFSGGEKKKAEMLQLLVLKPKYAIFDEIDTGLDVDALKIVAQGIGALKRSGCGILLITHYQRILDYIKPDAVSVMKQGKIVKEGDAALAKLIEQKGYAAI